MKNKLAFSLLTIFALGLVSEAAEARRGGRFVSSMIGRGVARGAAGKNYTTNTLTVTQLVECLQKASALDDESDALAKDRDLLEAKSSEVDAASASLKQRQATLNRYSQAAVDQFNSAVTQYNALVERAKVSQSGFNQKIITHNATVDSYNAQCAKAYYEDDMAIARGLAKVE